MDGIFGAIKRMLVYKRPRDPEGGFELLEDDLEGIDVEDVPSGKYQQQTGNEKREQAGENQNRGNKRNIKQPMPVDTWNRTKKDGHEDAECPNEKTCLVSEDLQANIEYLKKRFSMPKNQDIIIRQFKIARKIKAFILFVDEMADKTTINQFILPQLLSPQNDAASISECPMDYIRENVLSITQLTETSDFNKIISEVLNGLSALFIEGCDKALLMESRGFEKRNIDRPVTEQAVRGSQEGFTENLRTNLTLLRRIVKNPKLITEIIPVGKENRINSAMLYIEGIANPKIVREVRRRISNINIDFIEGNGMLEQLIEDSPFTLLPQVISTERPDRAASFLADGQVVIITEGCPFAMAVPVSFFHLFHSPEEAALRWQYGTFIRLIRLVGVFSALLVPGLYVALSLYHPEMIPSALLESIAKSRAIVPFPTILELVIMEISFELIREGGIRIPNVFGQTLGIVGALILGQVAVAAGLATPMLIVIVAVTGLGNFTMPNYSTALTIRILRFFFIFAGGIAGFYGISLALTAVAAMACHTKSFGQPFLSPVAPRTKINPDVIIRQPIFNQKMRPDPLNTPKRKNISDKPRAWTEKEDAD